MRPAAEPKSWVTDEPVVDLGAARAGARVYTHNAERYGRREALTTEAVAREAVEDDVEPSLRPPPQWMLILAGAAVAALMGALLGGFMHV